MDRDDVRIAAVLRELAELGRRIGDRAGELASLTMERRQSAAASAASSADAGMALVAARAADLAAGAAAVVADGGRARRRRSRSNTRPLAGRPPSRSWPRARRSPAVGPAVASVIVHLLMLSLLTAMYVTAEATPARVAIELGMAADTGEMTDAPFDEVSLVAFDVPQEDDVAMEPLPAVEAIVDEQMPIVAPASSEELLSDLPVADVAAEAGMGSFDVGEMLAEVAGGGQEAGRQQRVGAAGGETAHAGADTTFFGRAGQGRSVCFICDNSNSYRDGGFHAVLDELARAVESLRPQQSFFVIFSSDAAYPLFHPSSVDALQPATVENKQKLRAWLGTVEMCSGGQGIHDAVRLAGTLGADVIYLLSDGELGAGVVDRLKAADVGGSVVHTFGIQQRVVDRRTGLIDPDRLRQQQGRNQNLINIATGHGGSFTSVTVPAQVAVLERLRPIPRNRSRGAVWGVRL